MLWVVLCVPPRPGYIPIPVSGKPMLPFSVAIILSAESAISAPPPSASPFSFAITGFLDASILFRTMWPYLVNLQMSSI